MRVYRIKGRVIDAAAQSVDRFRVEAWDRSRKQAMPLASGTVLPNGSFDLACPQAADPPARKLLTVELRVFDGNRLVRASTHSVAPGAKRAAPIELRVQKRQAGAAIAAPKRHAASLWPEHPAVPLTLEALMDRGGFSRSGQTALRTLKVKTALQLLTPDGGGALLRAKIPAAQYARIRSVATFAALSGSATAAAHLVDGGVTSIVKLARTSAARRDQLSRGLSDVDMAAVKALSARAGSIASLLGDAVVTARASQSATGEWYAGSRPAMVDLLIDDKKLRIDDAPRCDVSTGCQNVFSPVAYLFDLLDFVADNWSLDAGTLAEIFRQDLDAIGCDTGMEPVLQTRLAIGVLEKYVPPADLPLNDAGWRTAFSDACASILSLADVAADALPPAAVSSIGVARPTVAALDAVLDAVRAVYGGRIDSQLPLPLEPGDDATAQAHYVEQRAQVERARQSARTELEQRTAPVAAAALAAYRDRLIARTGDSAATLERDLFIDLRAASLQYATPLGQALQSLQSLVLAARTGEIRTSRNAALASHFAASYSFDETAWGWLENYATWAAAMYAFVFPENVLAPPIFRSSSTPSFLRAVQMLAASSDRAGIAAARAAYDAELAVVGELRPISAHVIDDALYAFAKRDNELWMNATPLPAQRWRGWTRVREAKDDATPWATAVHRVAGETRMVVAYRHEVSLSKAEFFWVSSDGGFDENRIASLDLFDLPQTMGSTNYSFETHLFPDDELYPVVKLWGTPVEDNTLELSFGAVVGYGETVPAWQPGLGTANGNGVLVGGAYYGLLARPGDGHVTAGSIEITASGQNYSESFGPEQLGEPSLSNQAVTFDTAVLATSDTEVSYILIRTRTGSILCMDLALPDDGVARGTTVGVSASPARMSLELDAMLGTTDAEVHRFVRQVYFEESYLHFALLAAWSSRRSGDFAGAHDWYRTLCDPFAGGTRLGFPLKTYFAGALDRPQGWLRDPFDTFGLCAGRSSAYLRHIVLQMTTNLVEWAEHEFALATMESMNCARDLYNLAARVLQAPELGTSCEASLNTLRATILDRFEVAGLSDLVGLDQLAGVGSADIVLGTVRKLEKLLGAGASAATFVRQAKSAIDGAVRKDMERASAQTIGVIRDQADARRQSVENSVVGLLASNGGGPFDLLANPNVTAASLVPVMRSIDFAVPANPLVAQLDGRIQSGLAKLRTGRNIAGDTVPSSALQAYGMPGPIPPSPGAMPPLVTVELPRYRYSYLVERARQQAGLASQLGSALLQAIERRDDAAFQRVQADQALEIAQASVRLKSLIGQEARDAADVSQQQLGRAQVQRTFFDTRLDEGFGSGLSPLEVGGMALMGISGTLQLAASGVYAALALPAAMVAYGSATAAPATATAAAAGTVGAGVGATPGAAGTGMSMAGMLAGGVAGGQMLAQSFSAAGGAFGTFGSLALTAAGFQRRWQDWHLQRDLASFDEAIARDQIRSASDRIDIADQDVQISNLQSAHAQSVTEFLKARFSNTELYDWMIEVLREQYRTVVQIATSTALLAQASLEFERQVRIDIVSGDYWSIDLGSATANALTTTQRASGLLGAERLLTAMTRLDDFKLRTDRRQLQLSKTISLARMLPLDLVALRQTGRITFNTLLDWFDQDFPGHYLRLIKGIRVSIVALVPPADGIHAMLSNTGESSVVVQENGAFVKKRALRTFGEEIALDSPFNETGLFVFDYNDPMFLPFEGLGVETQWTIDLPQATNRFRLDTVADVMLTIEYTALGDTDYRAQVIARLGDTSNADAFIDVRASFPDEWYRLKNPLPAPTADQTTTLRIPSGLFPPNLLDTAASPLQLDQLSIAFVTDVSDPVVAAATRAALVAGVRLQKDGNTFSATAGVPGAITFPVVSSSVNYVLFSTRLLAQDGIAPEPSSPLLANTTPGGDWKLVLSPALFQPLAGGPSVVTNLDDVMLILSASGTVPW